jgi:hypothetical protein
MERIFRPDEVDLDSLVEAMRPLLEYGRALRRDASSRPHADLLSLPPRGTHVLEAAEAP